MPVYSSNYTLQRVMIRVRARFDRSAMTLEELGILMGYPDKTARNSAWQFLNKTADPKLSMLVKFTQAMRVPLGSIFPENRMR